MIETDLPAVNTIAAEVHPAFFERPEVLAEKLALYPAGCFVLERGSGPSGYLLSHPWPAKSFPPLDELVGSLPVESDSYYIHDLALRQQARGVGAAIEVLDQLRRSVQEAQFASMHLVAVNSSQPFWRRHGFSPMDLPHLAKALSLYEVEARLMVRTLT